MDETPDNANGSNITGMCKMQRFTSDGYWTSPAGITTIYVSGCGGGGGGSSGLSTMSDDTVIGWQLGAGGGSGGWSIKIPITVIPETKYTVIVGSAGIGETNSINTNGGDSKISLNGVNIWLAYGGSRGIYGLGGNIKCKSGEGGISGTGTLQGATGFNHGRYSYGGGSIFGFYGGSNYFQNGSLIIYQQYYSMNSIAIGYGAGGGGGNRGGYGSAFTKFNGASGAQGLVIIEW